MTGSEGGAIKFAIREVDFLDVQQGKLPPKKWESLRRDLRTLSKRPRVVQLLKELVEFDGLWDSMALAQFHLPTDVATRFPVEIGHYLSTLLDRWCFITHHPDLKEAKFRLDSVSAELLAGLWPAAPQRDRDRLDTLFTQADFLPLSGRRGLEWLSIVRCWTWTGES